jgi:hypothetical protein
MRRGGEILNMFNKIQELPKLASSNNIPEQPFSLDLLLSAGTGNGCALAPTEGPYREGFVRRPIQHSH